MSLVLTLGKGEVSISTSYITGGDIAIIVEPLYPAHKVGETLKNEKPREVHRDGVVLIVEHVSGLKVLQEHVNNLIEYMECNNENWKKVRQND